MGRKKLDLPGGRQLIYGYDRPFHSFYAQYWDPEFDPDFDWGAPAKAFGYHPDEQAIPPHAGEYGPYPVDLNEMVDQLRGWELPDDVISMVQQEMDMVSCASR